MFDPKSELKIKKVCEDYLRKMNLNKPQPLRKYRQNQRSGTIFAVKVIWTGSGTAGTPTTAASWTYKVYTIQWGLAGQVEADCLIQDNVSVLGRPKGNYDPCSSYTYATAFYDEQNYLRLMAGFESMHIYTCTTT